MLFILPEKLPKDVAALDVDGLAQWLMNNFTTPQIAQKCAEMIKKEQETTVKAPISVSQEEFDRIFSLFKIKGIRMVEGETVKETRGRPRLDSKK